MLCSFFWLVQTSKHYNTRINMSPNLSLYSRMDLYYSLELVLFWKLPISIMFVYESSKLRHKTRCKLHHLHKQQNTQRNKLIQGEFHVACAKPFKKKLEVKTIVYTTRINFLYVISNTAWNYCWLILWTTLLASCNCSNIRELKEVFWARQSNIYKGFFKISNLYIMVYIIYFNWIHSKYYRHEKSNLDENKTPKLFILPSISSSWL